MPTYYKHINGKKIGGLPEVVRVDDCFEQLLSNNLKIEKFENNKVHNHHKHHKVHKNHKHHKVHNDHHKHHKVHNHHKHHKHHNHHKHHKLDMDYIYEEDNLAPMLLDNRRISGFRFDLKKDMIGKAPYYSCYGEPCNRIEYKSDMYYPFLMNDDLLF